MRPSPTKLTESSAMNHSATIPPNTSSARMSMSMEAFPQASAPHVGILRMNRHARIRHDLPRSRVDRLPLLRHRGGSLTLRHGGLSEWVEVGNPFQVGSRNLLLRVAPKRLRAPRRLGPRDLSLDDEHCDCA